MLNQNCVSIKEKKTLEDDEILYKRIDEIKVDYLNINELTKKRVKINIGNQVKWVHLVDIEYKKPNKTKKLLLLIIPKQKLINIDYNKKIIKIETNDEIDKKIKSLENRLITVIHEKSSGLFNGKNFSIEKIKGALISNLKLDAKMNRSLSLTIGETTKIYEIEKTGKRRLINKMANEMVNENKNEYTHNCTYCKCVIYIENLQFVDNRFTYNLVVDLCEIERTSNYSFVIKNGELERRIADSEEDDDNLLDDEYWDSASI